MSGTGGFKTGGGGVSPQQAALAQYNFGQNLVENSQAFSSGLGHSTGVTQADVGAEARKAYDLGHMSNADANAMTSYFNQQKSQLASNVGGLGGALGGGGGGGAAV